MVVPGEPLGRSLAAALEGGRAASFTPESAPPAIASAVSSAGPCGRRALVVADWTPLVDIEETDREYLVKAELPDVVKENVKVEMREGVLGIQGERKKEKEEKGRKFHRVERSYGKFVRTFSIPEDVDETKVAAEFKDGILFVKLPKTTISKTKAFEVKVA